MCVAIPLEGRLAGKSRDDLRGVDVGIMGRAKKAAYVVFQGRIPGVYRSWDECQIQVSGFPGNSQRGYNTIEQAEDAWAEFITSNSARTDNPSDQKPNLKRSRQPEYIVIDDDDEPAPKRRQIGVEPSQEVSKPEELNMLQPVEEIFKEGESVVLTADQEAVVSMALKGWNIFLTGAGGCGKTVTLKHLLARFKALGVKAQVVAPTGIAALPLGGKTAYSYLGWKPESLRLSLDKLKTAPKQYVKKAIRATTVLIVEEVSMVENLFLERMNIVMQGIMDDRRPFGGKQVILLGDFHQLPPVKPFETCLYCGLLMSKDPPFRCEKCPEVSYNEGDKWAFKAKVWTDLRLKNVQLRQIHRQKDSKFQDILNKIRYGIRLTDEEWAGLEAKRPLPRGACAVRLMSLRKHVDKLNQTELNAIKFTPKSWEASDTYDMISWEQHGMTPWEMDQPLKNHRFPELLTLKVGAKVVLLTNLDQDGGLVNGSQGEVIGFEMRDNPNNSKAMYYTEPSKEKGKPPIIKAFVAPLVRFSNGTVKAIDPVESTSQHGTNQAPYRSTRVQIPLSLAWALTIHKSQGMTLKFVQVSKQDLFEPGQLYVALSRATDLEGLTVSGFSREQLPVDDEVLKFYSDTKWENLDSGQ